MGNLFYDKYKYNIIMSEADMNAAEGEKADEESPMMEEKEDDADESDKKST